MGLLDTFSFLDDVRRMDKRQVGISSAFLPNVEVQVMRSNNASSHISPDGFLASITLLSLVIDINIAADCLAAGICRSVFQVSTKLLADEQFCYQIATFVSCTENARAHDTPSRPTANAKSNQRNIFIL